jgi:tRNA pseudouridine38-40 synthase
MRNFKLTLEYDGMDFHGWQIQPDRRTVQGELCRAIEEITGERAAVTGAGRTDAGVHAVGQVASFRCETRLHPTVLCRALNATLPEDVRIRSAEEVSFNFNARFDAKSRTYQYLLIRRPTALWRNYYYLVTGELDIAAMRRALSELFGEKDFTAFASSDDDSATKRCTVKRAELVEAPPLVTLAITADHFLHHMVRSVAGTVLEIGRGKPWSMARIIEAKGRVKSGPTLPPHALYLIKVTY